MYLMRIEAAGSEKPAARISDTHSVDLSDVAKDFNGESLGTGGLNHIRGFTAESGQWSKAESTATRVFDPCLIVHHLSQFMVPEPDDLINTATSPGVGMGFTPPIWLQPGDVLELGIEGLGVQRQSVLAPR